MTEAQIQRAIFHHYRSRGADGVFAFAVPNGGYRRPIEAKILKSTGVVAGVPDTIWLRQGRMYALELKSDRGRLSAEQAAVMEAMEHCGAIVEVAYGLDAALQWLEQHGLLRQSRAA